MPLMIGRNINSNDAATVATIGLNAITAVTIAPANPNRIFLNVSLDAGTTDLDVFIRLHPAASNNDKAGILLARLTSGNDVLFWPQWTMSESNIYTGEVSAILDTGNVDVHVTEY